MVLTAPLIMIKLDCHFVKMKYNWKISYIRYAHCKKKEKKDLKRK